jgi:hypothetical protein
MIMPRPPVNGIIDIFNRLINMINALPPRRRQDTINFLLPPDANQLM